MLPTTKGRGVMDWKIELVAILVSDVGLGGSLLHREGRLQPRPRPQGQRRGSLRSADASLFGLFDRPGDRDLAVRAWFRPGYTDGRLEHKRRTRGAGRAGCGGQRDPGVRLGLVRLLQRSGRQQLGRATDSLLAVTLVSRSRGVHGEYCLAHFQSGEESPAEGVANGD